MLELELVPNRSKVLELVLGCSKVLVQAQVHNKVQAQEHSMALAQGHSKELAQEHKWVLGSKKSSCTAF